MEGWGWAHKNTFATVSPIENSLCSDNTSGRMARPPTANEVIKRHFMAAVFSLDWGNVHSEPALHH